MSKFITQPLGLTHYRITILKGDSLRFNFKYDICFQFFFHISRHVHFNYVQSLKKKTVFKLTWLNL